MYKQSPKSPAMKALVGNQSNLPEALQAAIKAAPAKMMGETPIKKKMPMAKVDGKNVPAFAADGKGENDLAKTPAKNYKKGYYGV